MATGLKEDPFEVGDVIRVKLKVFNLTQLFGAGNEPTSTDDPRIVWIEQYAAAYPEYNAGELVSADLNSVKYNDAVIAEVPESVRALSGYGWSAGDVYNSIERTDTGWQYVQRVGSFTLDGTEGFTLAKAHSEANGNSVFILKEKAAREKLNNVVNTTNLSQLSVCADLICVDARSSSNFISNTIAINGANYYIWIGLDADKYPDAAALNAWLSEYPVTVYYAFDKPVITDITDLMSGLLDAIPVEAGGTLTFENAAHLPMPSSVEYVVKLSEVNG